MKALSVITGNTQHRQADVGDETRQHPLVIRQLSSKDADVFHYLRVRCIESDPTSFSVLLEEEKAMSPLQIRTLLDRFHRAENSALWGGFCGDYLVGVIGLESLSGPVRHHRGIVTSLCVLPEYRGQHVGLALIGYLVEQAEQNALLESLALEVSESALPAIRLYQQMGFKENGREPRALAFGDQRLDLIRMNRLV